VILSGGDPLTLSDERLARLTTALETIPHIRRLRIHTRQPVVLPSRVDEGLLRWLSACRLQKVVVLHMNHAQELNDELREACARLRQAGAVLFNQSVLLRSVNDSATALAELSEALFGAGVTPYYLNLLDPVAGAAHFDVPEAEALALVAELRARLPGYLVPRLVREVPGAPSKLPVRDVLEYAAVE
jgi:KamA family protein